MIVAEDSQKYMFEKHRLASFKGKWKPLRGFEHCTPANFAASGFYYPGAKGSGDSVKCFVCQIELGDWEKDDHPWEEHKKRGQECYFVKLRSKGDKVKLVDMLQLYAEMKKNIIIDMCKKRVEQLEDMKDSAFESLERVSVKTVRKRK